ncbi:MAG TPA: ferritin family protein [Burkholderiales bacterium]|nr:ferritin family protein [Burkholderiales bacterium]
MAEQAELGGGVAALYAHALAIEREAAQRYGEFAARMADQGNDAVARLFAELAGFEAEHARALERECTGMALPQIAPSQFAWLDAGAPETAAHDLVFRLMTPHDALEIALAAELRAQAFFEQVLERAVDPRLRDLAAEMAREELSHAAWVREALARTPDPHVDWEQVYSRR